MVAPRERVALARGRALAALLRRSEVHLEPGVMVFGRPLITAVPGARVDIASGVRLVSTSRSTPLGVNHQVVIRALRDGATISIGEDTGISGGTICSLTSVTLGSRCLLGANVTIADSDFHPVHQPDIRYKADAPASSPEHAVVIGDQVFIGTGSIVLKGVRIGANSVVGAGSVVTASFPENSIVAGNPARLIGEVKPEQSADVSG